MGAKWNKLGLSCLPVEDVPVLTYCEEFDSMVVLSRTIDFSGRDVWSNDVPLVESGITHWMSLPAPPTAENVEGANLQPTTAVAPH